MSFTIIKSTEKVSQRQALKAQESKTVAKSFEMKKQPESRPKGQITTLVETPLSMQVDCVAWNRKYNVIAIGGYELDEEDTTTRKGLLYLIQLNSKSNSGFCYLQEITTPGVLDLKWDPFTENMLAVGTSNSILIFQIINAEEGKPMLEMTHEKEFTSMCVFLNWVNENRIVFSDSDGAVSILEVTPARALEIIDTIQLHKYTVWVVHYSPYKNCLFTGADDGSFHAFQLKHLMRPERHYTKAFKVGVTSVLTQNDIVAIGDYDEKLRIFTLAMTRLEEPDEDDDDSPSFTIDMTIRLVIELGGGVWRTCWLPEIAFEEQDPNEFLIAVAAARNGVQVLRFNRSTWKSETILHCKNHVGSLAYGLDINVLDDEYTVATCYFDNHMLHVWKFSI